MTLRRTYQWLPVLLVLLYAAWLGARSLNADAIWLDEYYSIYESGGGIYGPLSPSEMLARIVTNSVWSPAYNIILALWGAFAGWQPVVGRVLFWLLGLLAVAVTYRLGRQLFPNLPLVAVGAAVFLAGSAFYIYYLHELRAYTLHVLAGCATMSLYWSLLHATTRPRLKQIGFTCAATLLLYSHPVGQLWLAALAGYHILFARHTPHWNRIIFLFLLAGTAYVPWVGVMLVRMGLQIEMPRGTNPLLILQTASTAFTNQIPLVVGLLCLLTLPRLNRKPIQFLWVTLVGLIALVLLMDRFVSFLFHIRHLIAALPVVMLLAAAGLAQLRLPRWILVLALGGWLALGAYLSFNDGYLADLPNAAPTLPNPGFDTTHRYLNDHAAPGDVVLFQFSDSQGEFLMSLPLEYYFHDSQLRVSLLSMVSADNHTAPFDQRLRDFVDDAPYLWTADVTGHPANASTAALETLLTEAYLRCGTLLDLPDMQLTLYAHSTRGNCEARIAAADG